MAFDQDKMEVIYYKNVSESETDKKNNKGSHPFINFATTFFLIIVALVYSLTNLSYYSKTILLVIPVAFGFLLYYMSYKQAKDYLKKITDTITLLSSLISLLAIIYGLNLGKFLFNTDEKIILRICLFIVLQSFSIFATLKLIISFRETLDERKKYYDSFSFADKETKPKTLFKRTAQSFISACAFAKSRIKSLFQKN